MFVVLYSDSEIIVCPYDEKNHAAVGAEKFFRLDSASTRTVSVSTGIQLAGYRQLIGELPLQVEIRARPRMKKEFKDGVEDLVDLA